MPLHFRHAACFALLAVAACGAPENASNAQGAGEAERAVDAAAADGAEGVAIAEAEGGDVHEDAAHADEHDGADGHDAHGEHDEDHDQAGGAPHVHGGAELALAVDGSTVSVELVSPLANFGLAEAGDALLSDDGLATFLDAREALLKLEGEAGCGLPQRSARVEAEGDHGEAVVAWSFECAEPDKLSGLTLTLFEVFDGFEEVDAIALVGGGQAAGELSAAQPSLTFD